MLNYETLLSSYDDKLTLMQWLKKVEAALKDASAVAFNVTKTGDATLTFSIDFEDGSKIESGPIVLQQGESVESAAITNGHLFLTLTNGDVLDAGNLFNGNVTLSGNLSVTGTISGNMPVLTTAGDEISAQKPVVEVMTGYSTSISSTTAAEFETNYSYVGVAKNGNKLTFVVAGTLKLLQARSRLDIGSFTIPASVGSRIYGSSLYSWVEVKTIPVFANINDYKTLKVAMNKASDTNLAPLLYCDDLATDTTYYFRYECTILLSDSLI